MRDKLKTPGRVKTPVWKIILRVIGIILLIALLIVGGYVIYLQANYYRIEDDYELSVKDNAQTQIQTGQSYTLLTWNTGFGAYNPEFSFFMDTGYGKDGTYYQGERSTAESLEAVESNVSGMKAILTSLNADMMILQEVDEKATRSHGVNMVDAFESSFPKDGAVYAQNFHSVFLAYPFNDPHGSVDAGLLTLSSFDIDEAIRYSYPVDESFPTKFFDLDRCFSACFLPVAGSTKSLVLVNSHMSAYDEGGTVRDEQMQVLSDFLSEQYSIGNYVIVGGDFNQILTGEDDHFESIMEVPDWVFPFDESLLPEGYQVVDAKNSDTTPSIRGTETAYVAGESYTTIVDGFIISDNITAGSEIIDTAFQYSDHNPVLLTFTLI